MKKLFLYYHGENDVMWLWIPLRLWAKITFPTDLFQPQTFRPGEMMLSAPATIAHSLLIEQHLADG